MKNPKTAAVCGSQKAAYLSRDIRIPGRPDRMLERLRGALTAFEKRSRGNLADPRMSVEDGTPKASIWELPYHKRYRLCCLQPLCQPFPALFRALVSGHSTAQADGEG